MWLAAGMVARTWAISSIVASGAERSLKSLPKPNNLLEKLTTVPEATAPLKQRLFDRLARQGLTAQDEVIMAFYNPPRTPPLLRRNEIMVKLQNSDWRDEARL